MASLYSYTKILILLLFFINFSSSVFSSASYPVSKSQNTHFLKQRLLFDATEDENLTKKPLLLKKKSILSTKNQTKLTKPKKTDIIAVDGIAIAKTTKTKLNKTLTSIPKQSNSTKPLKSLTTNTNKSSQRPNLDAEFTVNTTKPSNPNSPPLDATGDDIDLLADIRDLHSRLVPDLKGLSISSKAYISAANRGIAENMKPIVGKSFASKIAPLLSSLSLLLPLFLIALLFRRLRSLLSLDRLLVFIQTYLAIYFATLAVAALATGLDPLRFLYATSPASYTWAQAVQTLAYLVYLVAQLADLVALFASEPSGAGEDAARGLGLAQMVIGLCVGAHYYVAVFRRAVNGAAPRANWRVHLVYAVCFVVICACSRAEKRKKRYGGGKSN